MKTVICRIYKVVRWWVLFALSITSFVVLLIPAFLLHLFFTFYKSVVGVGLDKLDKDYRNVVYAINVLYCATLFNWFNFKKRKVNYGNKGDTIDNVLRKRKENKELTFLDKIIVQIWNVFSSKDI